MKQLFLDFDYSIIPSLNCMKASKHMVYIESCNKFMRIVCEKGFYYLNYCFKQKFLKNFILDISNDSQYDLKNGINFCNETCENRLARSNNPNNPSILSNRNSVSLTNSAQSKTAAQSCSVGYVGKKCDTGFDYFCI